jgi:hypothetical protein
MTKKITYPNLRWCFHDQMFVESNFKAERADRWIEFSFCEEP